MPNFHKVSGLLLLCALAGPAAFAGDPAREFQVERDDAGAYQPTQLEDMEAARKLFNQMRDLKLDQPSESTSRQQVWASELAKRSGIKSMHAFMFFSPKFQEHFARETLLGLKRRFPWWFHSAPLVYVKGAPMVLDPKFMDGPAPLDVWSFTVATKIKGSELLPLLTPAHTHCRGIENYRELRANNISGADWCNFRIVPMYYVYPNDVEALDCDPEQDSWKDAYPAKRLSDGSLKYPCFKRALHNFDPANLRRAKRDLR